MCFKVVFLAVAVLACQANAQNGGFIRPLIAGYANGVVEMAKPFVQWGQNLVSPAADYFASVRPQAGQWMVYPSRRPLAQAQAAAYEGYEALTSALPNGASVVQIVRPRPFNPQMVPVAAQNTIVKPLGSYPVPGQDAIVKPLGPYPVPAPEAASSSSSSSSEESQEAEEQFVPTNLLPEQSTADFAVEVPTGGKVPMTLEAKDVPVLQRPALPLLDN